MKNLKNYLIASLLVLASNIAWSQCPTPDPIDKKALQGTWSGSYSTDGKFLDMKMKIKDEDGTLQASIDIPAVEAKDVSYEARVCKSQELHIKKVDGTTSIEFRGRPIGDKLSGKVIFCENDIIVAEEVFTLKKTSSNIASN